MCSLSCGCSLNPPWLLRFWRAALPQQHSFAQPSLLPLPKSTTCSSTLHCCPSRSAVLRSSSPLVRHLTIVAEPATGVAPTRRSKATVVRARRAWLPPSTVWLFRPRNYEHDIGERSKSCVPGSAAGGGWRVKGRGRGASLLASRMPR